MGFYVETGSIATDESARPAKSKPLAAFSALRDRHGRGTTHNALTHQRINGWSTTLTVPKVASGTSPIHVAAVLTPVNRRICAGVPSFDESSLSPPPFATDRGYRRAFSYSGRKLVSRIGARGPRSLYRLRRLYFRFAARLSRPPGLGCAYGHRNVTRHRDRARPALFPSWHGIP